MSERASDRARVWVYMCAQLGAQQTARETLIMKWFIKIQMNRIRTYITKLRGDNFKYYKVYGHGLCVPVLPVLPVSAYVHWALRPAILNGFRMFSFCLYAGISAMQTAQQHTRTAYPYTNNNRPCIVSVCRPLSPSLSCVYLNRTDVAYAHTECFGVGVFY